MYNSKLQSYITYTCKKAFPYELITEMHKINSSNPDTTLYSRWLVAVIFTIYVLDKEVALPPASSLQPHAVHTVLNPCWTHWPLVIDHWHEFNLH